MIEELTEEQRGKFPQYVDKWIKIGTCTEPVDQEEAKKAVSLMYTCGGLEPPRGFKFFSGPVSMYKYIAKNKIKNSVCNTVRDSVRDSVWSSVEDSVRDSVYDSVWSSVWSSVSDSVWDSVCDSICDSVYNSVWDSVYDGVYDSVWSSIWSSVRRSVCDSVSVYDSICDSVRRSVCDSVSVYGQHEAHWLCYYNFFREECQLKNQTDPLQGLFQVAKACGWIYLTKDTAYICEKPYICKLDENNKLHSDEGPAIAYRDGLKIYVTHGRVTKTEVTEEQTEQLEESTIVGCNKLTNTLAGSFRPSEYSEPTSYPKDFHPEVVHQIVYTQTRDRELAALQIKQIQRTLREFPLCNISGVPLELVQKENQIVWECKACK